MERKELDLLFVHPPAVVSKQKLFVDSDVAFSDQFVSIPMGFFSMVDTLEKNGFKAKIINLGERMLKKENGERLEDLISNIFTEFQPTVVGIDIHWWVHSAGAIRTAQIIKNLGFDCKIVVGGITSSYYAEEILANYEVIDFVMVGECDYEIIKLVEEIKKEELDLVGVPNLVYRRGGKIVKNPVRLPDITDSLEITRYDALVDKPRVNEDRAIVPITRGCVQDCCYCGASRESFNWNMQRPEMSMIKPSLLVNMIKKNRYKGRDKIYIYGDVRQGGLEYVEEFFDLLTEAEISITHIVFELFNPPTQDYLQRWVNWANVKNNTLEVTLSPDTGNEKLRAQVGRHYSNKKILESCQLITDMGIPLSVYFLFGLPGQTLETVEETLQLAEEIVKIYSSRFKHHDVRHEVIGYELMQIPDVGSKAYRNQKKYGLNIEFDGFVGLVDLILKARHWSELIGFSTIHFTKKQLVETYYYLRERILQTYHKYEVIGLEEFQKKVKRLKADKQMYTQILKSN